MFKRLKEIFEKIDYIEDRVSSNHKVLFERRNEADNLMNKYRMILRAPDPMNKSGNEYLNFVNGMDAAYQDGLKEKIEHMVSQFQMELSRMPITEQEAAHYRAAIHFGLILLEYGDEIHAKKAALMAGEDTEDEDLFNS